MKKKEAVLYEEFFILHDILVSLVIVGLLILGFSFSNQYVTIVIVNISVILLYFYWFFFLLNIYVGEKYVVLFFNTPIFQKTIYYNEIKSCEVVEGKWWKNSRLQTNISRYPLGISFTNKALKIIFKDPKRKPMLVGMKKVDEINDHINQFL